MFIFFQCLLKKMISLFNLIYKNAYLEILRKVSFAGSIHIAVNIKLSLVLILQMVFYPNKVEVE